MSCHAESVEWILEEGRKRCRCRACGRTSDRALVIDPGISWWVSAEHDYWHETAGVFVRDPRGRFLFFDRTAFPFALTVPAGHLERHEKPVHGAARELLEETGIGPAGLKPIGTEPITGDACRRGADAHLWHTYLLDVGEQVTVALNTEGVEPVWLTLDDALSRRLTPAVRHLVARHAGRLSAPS